MMRRTLLKLGLSFTGRNIYAEYDWLKKRAKQPLEENLALQQKRLKKILFHAARNVPYYKKLLNECGTIENGQVILNKFQKIPVLTRELLQTEFKSLKSHDDAYLKRGPYVSSSGGSTGQPVKFIQDDVYWTRSNAVKWLFFSFAADYPCKTLSLWGSERDILRQAQSLRSRVADFLLNRKLLNSFRMTPKNMIEYIAEINTSKPEIIEAYVQPIYELSRFITIKKIENLHKPKGIISAAGTLHPSIREQIENSFGCRVYNRYGTREVGDIACSCEFSNELHVDVFNNFIEILDKNLEPCSPGETGQVYVTTLNNFSMPLIRYNLGDIAIPAKSGCQCGRGLPAIKSVEGRETTVIRTQKGGIVPAEFFIHFVGVVFNKGYIERFQVIQEEYKQIRIKVVLKDEKLFLEEKSSMESAIREVMGKDCEVIWDFVSNIPPLSSGKYLYVVSNVSD